MCDLNDTEEEFHCLLVSHSKTKVFQTLSFLKSVYKPCQLLSSNRSSLSNSCKFFLKFLIMNILYIMYILIC